MGWRDGPLLGFDLETTGLGVHEDLPVQVALVWTMPEAVVDGEVFFVDPLCEIPDEAIAVHGITTARARAEGLPLEEAAKRIHANIGRALTEGVPIVAMNARFDVTIAEEMFRAFGLPPLEWTALIDPLVLDRRIVAERVGKRHLEALCGYYGVTLTNAHDAMGDALAAVAVARQMGRYFGEIGELDPSELTVRQAAWHWQWAELQDASLCEQDLPGLEAEDYLWPCRLGPGLSVACAVDSASMALA